MRTELVRQLDIQLIDLEQESEALRAEGELLDRQNRHLICGGAAIAALSLLLICGMITAGVYWARASDPARARRAFYAVSGVFVTLIPSALCTLHCYDRKYGIDERLPQFARQIGDVSQRHQTMRDQLPVVQMLPQEETPTSDQSGG
jgi:hypothetical protein